MELLLKEDCDFIIENGKLAAVDQRSFFVDKKGGILVITASDGACCVGNISQISGLNIYGGNYITSINGNNVCINGINISVRGKEVEIIGDVDKIIHNGQDIAIEKDTQKTEKKLKKNEYFSYSIDEIKFTSIKIEAAGSLLIKENNCVSDDKLMLIVSGSGDIKFKANEMRIKNLSISVAGSGDIAISKVIADYLNASIAGSGDIVIKKSSFDNSMLTVAGSGDIFFKNTIAKNITKNIVGSGDILGV